MAKINLLPWREELRQTQKKHYLISLAAISAGVFVLFWIAVQVFDQQVRNQNSRNNYLKQQIEVLDREIKQIKEITAAKDEISIRMALIEQLQVSRNLTPIVFDELARIVPGGISFTDMVRTDNQLRITGVSESNNRLSSFMRSLETSEVFINPVLSSIKADRSGVNAVSDFELTFSISPKYGPLGAQSATLEGSK